MNNQEGSTNYRNTEWKREQLNDQIRDELEFLHDDGVAQLKGMMAKVPTMLFCVTFMEMYTSIPKTGPF